MQCFVLLTVLAFASKNENDFESAAANLGEKIMVNAEENSILVKIEDDEYVKKKNKSSRYFGVYYFEKTDRWVAQRWSKTENKVFYNGYQRDEETAAHASDTLARKLMVNGEQNHKLNFPDDNTEVHFKKQKSSHYIGVSYKKDHKRWAARRWSRTEKKLLSNGGNHNDEETAAHASDTLARQLMANGDQDLKLNFPDDSTDVYPETKTSKYLGVYYNEKLNRWVAQRWSKTEHKEVHNGANHRYEKTAAHASDTLARKLMANGEENLKLNFPDDNAEVQPEEKTTSSKYFGVSFIEKKKMWAAQRWSKMEKKLTTNGANYKDEETAARASDTLARKLMANGENNHKLNFPNENTEVYREENQTNKRKRSFDFEYSQKDGNNFKKFQEKED